MEAGSPHYVLMLPFMKRPSRFAGEMCLKYPDLGLLCVNLYLFYDFSFFIYRGHEEPA